MELTGQMLRFVLAGGFVTIVDFLGYNFFLRYVRKNSRVAANMLSVTLAMMVSFLLNRLWVFSELNSGGWPVGAFLAVTLTSAYGIQSGVIYLLSKKWSPPASLISPLSRWLDADEGLVAEIVERNLVKVVAVAVGLVWNFSWYRLYVFN